MFSAVVVSSRVEPGPCHLFSLDTVLCLARSLSRLVLSLVVVLLSAFQKMNFSETFQVGLPPPLAKSDVSHVCKQQLQNNVSTEPTSQGT